MNKILIISALALTVMACERDYTQAERERMQREREMNRPENQPVAPENRKNNVSYNTYDDSYRTSSGTDYYRTGSSTDTNAARDRDPIYRQGRSVDTNRVNGINAKTNLDTSGRTGTTNATRSTQTTIFTMPRDDDATTRARPNTYERYDTNQYNSNPYNSNPYNSNPYDTNSYDRNADMDRSNDYSNVDYDNTRMNMRDRDQKTLTPEDQSENADDRAITQRIRQAIMADDALSTNAKNIKIITIQRVVTLRGPVLNEREKNAIAQKVSNITGVSRVDNQLDVTRNNK